MQNLTHAHGIMECIFKVKGKGQYPFRAFLQEKGLVCSDCACADFSQLFRKQYSSVYFPHINKGITSCVGVGPIGVMAAVG